MVLPPSSMILLARYVNETNRKMNSEINMTVTMNFVGFYRVFLHIRSAERFLHSMNSSMSIHHFKLVAWQQSHLSQHNIVGVILLSGNLLMVA